MDPLQVTAACSTSPVRKGAAEEIEAFYEDNAFETLHAVRRALGHVVRLLRSAPGQCRRRGRAAPEIASAARQA